MTMNRHDHEYILGESSDLTRAIKWMKSVFDGTRTLLRAELFGYCSPSETRRYKKLLSNRRRRRAEKREERCHAK